MVHESKMRKLLHHSDKKNFILYLIICSLVTVAFLIFAIGAQFPFLGITGVIYALYTGLGIAARKGKSGKLTLGFMIFSWIIIGFWMLFFMISVVSCTISFEVCLTANMGLYYYFGIIFSLALVSVLGVIFMRRVRHSYKDIKKQKHRLVKH
jgi:hypothetical protein